MQLRLSIDVAAPALATWTALADFGAIAGWDPDLALSSQVKGRGVERGAVRDLVFAKPAMGIAGVRERVVDCGEGWFRYVLDGGFGPYPDAGSTWRVTGDGKSSRVAIESHVRGGPWWAWCMQPLVKLGLRGGLRRALAGFKAYVETGRTVA